MQKMIVTIGADGSVKVAVHGVKGRSCSDVSRAIESALGKVTSDKKTSEYVEVCHDVQSGH